MEVSARLLIPFQVFTYLTLDELRSKLSFLLRASGADLNYGSDARLLNMTGFLAAGVQNWIKRASEYTSENMTSSLDVRMGGRMDRRTGWAEKERKRGVHMGHPGQKHSQTLRRSQLIFCV